MKNLLIAMTISAAALSVGFANAAAKVPSRGHADASAQIMKSTSRGHATAAQPQQVALAKSGSRGHLSKSTGRGHLGKSTSRGHVTDSATV
jgi:hypothetical protein